MARVLIVDDEVIIRSMLAECLKDEGHDVSSVETASAALQFLAEEGADVVVSDIVLPEMDGLALLERIRGVEPTAKVVLITGAPSLATAASALRLGAFDYLEKPVDLAAIQRVVAAAAHVKAVEDENRRYRETLEALVVDRTQRIEAYSRRLREMTERIKGILRCHEMGSLAPEVLRLFADTMAAEGGSFMIQRDGFLELLVSLDPTHQPRRIPLPLESDSVLGRVFDSREGFAVRDIGEMGLQRSGWSGYRDGSLLCLPCLGADGEIVGVVTLHNKETPPFTDEDVQIGRILAGHCVEAIRAVDLHRRLAESERRYRALIEHSADVVVLLDREWRITYVSPALERTLKLDASDVVGWSGLEFVHPEDRERVAATLERIIQTPGDSERVEYRIRRRDGTSSCLASIVTNLLDEPAVQALVVNQRDITDKRLAEVEHERLTGELLHAQKMEAVGRLAGGVAHDFNNVITGIMGYADLILLNVGPGSPIAGDIQEIQAAAERAAGLTRQLLAFSRRQVIAPRLLDVNQQVDQCRRLLQRLIGEDMTLSMRQEPLLWTTRVDPGQLDQVLMNLATNAREAMPDGGTLSIETSNVVLDGSHRCVDGQARAGEYVCISLSDDGPGIESDVLEHVFEPFFTTKERGTGLGLSTVYGIVTQHGGALEVTSQSGHGTTFRIYLPRVEAGPTDASNAPAVSSLPRGSEVLLVVEDEDGLRHLLDAALGALGYVVLTAANATEALDVSRGRAGQIDLLLTDVVLPGLNGRQLWERLLESRPNLPCLFVSGYAEDVIARRGILDDGVHHVAKPFTLTDIATAVRGVLDGTIR